MHDFVEIVGASGQSYRFRYISGLDGLPATSGNFVLMRAGEPAPICCGSVDSLQAAAQAWSEVSVTKTVDSVYVRLNVSIRVRISEHEDIVARQHPEFLYVRPA